MPLGRRVNPKFEYSNRPGVKSRTGCRRGKIRDDLAGFGLTPDGYELDNPVPLVPNLHRPLGDCHQQASRSGMPTSR